MTRSVVLLGFALCLLGCASQRPAAKEAAPPDATLPPREQIAQLEQRIAARRAQLGLPQITPQRAAEAAAMPAAPPPMPAQPAQEDAAVGATETPPGQKAAGGRCGDVCRARDDICGYGRRICRLASEIGDDDSAKSCQRAQADCTEAGRLCDTCS